MSATGGISSEPLAVDTVRPKETSNEVAGINAALSAARLAVAYDAENNLPAAFRAYNTAVSLLDAEIRIREPADTTKLKKILEAYSERISLLRTIVPLEHQFCFDDESIFSPERDLGFSKTATTPISTTPISEESSEESPSWKTGEFPLQSRIKSATAASRSTTTKSKFSSTATLLGGGPARTTSLASRNFTSGSSVNTSVERPASPKKGRLEGDKLGNKWSFVDILREEPLEAPPETLPPFGPHRNFWLSRALARSMTSGGYVTKKLYVPRLLWRQPGGARLLALETKISTCEAVAVACEAARAACGLDLAAYEENGEGVQLQATDAPSNAGQFVLPITARHFQPPRDLAAALRELDVLADVMVHAQVTLARKLAFVPEPGDSTNNRDSGSTGGGGNESFRGFVVRSGSSSSIGKTKGDEEGIEDKENGEKDTKEKEKEGNRSSVGKASGLRGWGGRISKSVERIHASVSRDRVDDASSYIDAMVRIFKAAQFLDDWLYHIEQEAQGNSEVGYRIYARLKQSSEFLGIVAAFVLSDLNVLMKKYLKRRRIWISE